MTAVAVAPWTAAEVDPESALADLRHRFPGVCAWFGEFTGRWWAVTRRELVEAADPVELARRLEAVLPARNPVPPRGVMVGPSGQWTTATVPCPNPPRAPVALRPARRWRHARTDDRPALWRRVLGAFVVREVRS
ncbi:hypothetical protein DPM19_29780 [Actinomadura craniellae]|uniref:Uncharacterized protein n=1 Tax=Actinomadura craniellae TaxID=2231787 RepID=A0A365GXD3_9ACTN|nr:hypothetical protein [Actinomadura craniellae]RAY11497.1 hypothetical protein DPM19_29780 [Actinomadura craniellae]